MNPATKKTAEKTQVGGQGIDRRVLRIRRIETHRKWMVGRQIWSIVSKVAAAGNGHQLDVRPLVKLQEKALVHSVFVAIAKDLGERAKHGAPSVKPRAGRQSIGLLVCDL